MMEKEKELGNLNIYDFIAEASKKAMLYWSTMERNHNEIINMIKKYTEDKEYTSLKKWDEITQKYTIQRIYKTINIPQEYPRLK